MDPIQFAGYGVYNQTINVTASIRDAFNRGERVFLANNSWGGDPAPGQRKYLYIVWQNGVSVTSGVSGEGDAKGVIVEPVAKAKSA